MKRKAAADPAVGLPGAENNPMLLESPLSPKLELLLHFSGQKGRRVGRRGGEGAEEVDKKPNLGVGFRPCIKKVQIKEKKIFHFLIRLQTIENRGVWLAAQWDLCCETWVVHSNKKNCNA
jgi:hypothetical protein